MRLDPDMELRVRLADKFGCPISEVGGRVPAWEVPYWREYYAKEPWGFKAWDMIASKTAMQVSSAMAKMKPGTGHRDFMFSSPYESGDLSNEAFDQLSPEEQAEYVQRQISRAKMVLN